MKRRSMANIAGVIITSVVLLSGCTTIRRLQASYTEDLLAAAGFRMERVDTADVTPGNAMSPYRLVRRIKDGAVQYIYADPSNCRCVYVGGSKEYAEYRRLAAERQMADEQWYTASSVWDRDDWRLEWPW